MGGGWVPREGSQRSPPSCLARQPSPRPAAPSRLLAVCMTWRAGRSPPGVTRASPLGHRTPRRTSGTCAGRRAGGEAGGGVLDHIFYIGRDETGVVVCVCGGGGHLGECRRFPGPVGAALRRASGCCQCFEGWHVPPAPDRARTLATPRGLPACRLPAAPAPPPGGLRRPPRHRPACCMHLGVAAEVAQHAAVGMPGCMLRDGGRAGLCQDGQDREGAERRSARALDHPRLCQALHSSPRPRTRAPLVRGVHDSAAVKFCEIPSPDGEAGGGRQPPPADRRHRVACRCRGRRRNEEQEGVQEQASGPTARKEAPRRRG